MAADSPPSPALERLLGKAIFTSDEDNEGYVRGLITPIFAKAHISDLSSLDVNITSVPDIIPPNRSTVDSWPRSLAELPSEQQAEVF